MSMFYNNPLIDKKIVSSVKEFLETQRKEENLLPPEFLEEAKKASVALEFCKSLEDKTMILREYFNIASSKQSEPVTPTMMNDFTNLVENYAKTV